MKYQTYEISNSKTKEEMYSPKGGRLLFQQVFLRSFLFLLFWASVDIGILSSFYLLKTWRKLGPALEADFVN